MCGLFGVIGKNIYPTLVKTGIEKANTRGAHGCGVVAWVGNLSRGVWKFSGQPDAGKDGVLDFLFKDVHRRPTAILYHARLATSGNYELEQNLQPFDFDGLFSVHNGNVIQCSFILDLLKHDIGFEPVTQVDSEIIPAAVRWNQGSKRNSIGKALKLTVDEILSEHSAVIISDGKTMAGHSEGLPLYKYEVDGATYFCSRKIEILEAKGAKVKNDGETTTAAGS